MAEVEAPDDIVWIINKEKLGDKASIGGPVTRAALNEVLAIDGWEEVAPEFVRATNILGRQVLDFGDLSKVELTTLAARSGIPFDSKASEKDLIPKIKERLVVAQTSEVPDQALGEAQKVPAKASGGNS